MMKPAECVPLTSRIPRPHPGTGGDFETQSDT